MILVEKTLTLFKSELSLQRALFCTGNSNFFLQLIDELKLAAVARLKADRDPGNDARREGDDHCPDRRDEFRRDHSIAP